MKQHLEAAGSSVVVPSTEGMIETVVDALFRAISASEQPANIRSGEESHFSTISSIGHYRTSHRGTDRPRAGERVR
jgi:hypothetical protein